MKPYAGDDPKHMGKSFPDFAFTFYHVHDPAAAHIPKDPAALSLVDPAAVTSTVPVQQQQQQQQATVTQVAAATATPTPANDPWSKF